MRSRGTNSSATALLAKRTAAATAIAWPEVGEIVEKRTPRAAPYRRKMTSPAAAARTPSGWTEPVARPMPHKITERDRQPAHGPDRAGDLRAGDLPAVDQGHRQARPGPPLPLAGDARRRHRRDGDQPEEIQPRIELAQGLVQILAPPVARRVIPPARAPLAERGRRRLDQRAGREQDEQDDRQPGRTPREARVGLRLLPEHRVVARRPAASARSARGPDAPTLPAAGVGGVARPGGGRSTTRPVGCRRRAGTPCESPDQAQATPAGWNRPNIATSHRFLAASSGWLWRTPSTSARSHEKGQPVRPASAADQAGSSSQPPTTR